jgi:hypothetical protein
MVGLDRNKYAGSLSNAKRNVQIQVNTGLLGAYAGSTNCCRTTGNPPVNQDGFTGGLLRNQPEMPWTISKSSNSRRCTLNKALDGGLGPEQTCRQFKQCETVCPNPSQHGFARGLQSAGVSNSLNQMHPDQQLPNNYPTMPKHMAFVRVQYA